jgi:hypothetical protein
MDSVFKKYWILRSTAWSQDNLDMLIDEYENDIYYSGAYLRKMERCHMVLTKILI